MRRAIGGAPGRVPGRLLPIARNMNKKKGLNHKVILLSCLMLQGIAPARAQVKDVSTILSSWDSIIKTIVDPVMNIVSVVLGLIGFVKLLPIFSKFIKGEPTSADAFLNHGGGFIIAVVIMQLIRLVII